jgi:hypothetical protein
LIIRLSPGGRLEEFFEEGARRRRNPASAPPSREELVALYAEYNVELLGERLTKEDFAKARALEMLSVTFCFLLMCLRDNTFEISRD